MNVSPETSGVCHNCVIDHPRVTSGKSNDEAGAHGATHQMRAGQSNGVQKPLEHRNKEAASPA